MTSKLIAGTVRAPVAAATAPVKEKNLMIFADDVISSDVPVDSVSGCKDLYTCIQNLIEGFQFKTSLIAMLVILVGLKKR